MDEYASIDIQFWAKIADMEYPDDEDKLRAEFDKIAKELQGMLDGWLNKRLQDTPFKFRVVIE